MASVMVFMVIEFLFDEDDDDYYWKNKFILLLKLYSCTW